MKKTIGYTTGVFDMFHIGHLNILKRAKEHCDFLIVGVTTDELCESYKHKLPIIPFEERKAIIGRLGVGKWQIFGAHGFKKDYSVNL